MKAYLRFLSGILRKVLQTYMWFPSNFFSLQKMAEVLFSFYRKDTLNLPTFREHHFRLNGSQRIHNELSELARLPEIGIIVQGPIRHEYSFTLQTIKMYLSNFPSSPIILSTWNDENIIVFQSLASQNSNLHIITQEKPKNPGISNINLQISSTMAGLEKLQILNCRYAVKTRTDQCMFDPLALVKLKNSYNLNFKDARILVLSLGSFLFRPYGPSDFFQFGLLETLSEFWSVVHDYRLSTSGFVFRDTSTLREFAKNEMCEVYLTTSYLRSKGEILDFSLRNSLLMYKKYFHIIDPPLIDLVWDKYTLLEGRWNQSSFPKPYQEMSEGIWLTLETSIDNLAQLDYLLDIPVIDRDFIPDRI